MSFTDDIAIWGMFPSHVLVDPNEGQGRLCLCWLEAAAMTWVARTDVREIPITHFAVEEFVDNLEMSREAYRRWPTEEMRLNWLEHEH
jgi:hypothetical protein